MEYIINNFADENIDYGKKGNNLRILGQIFHDDENIFIPDTLTLTCSLYEEILKNNVGSNFLDYRKLNINPQLMTTILDVIHQKFGDRKLVIRSSATCEDSIFFSASGQYDSFLNINGDGPITDAIKKVYVSLFSSNSQLYSKIYGIDLSRESMAVLIQPVAPVVKSGVMFSCDPTDYSNKYIIESSKGLGTNVVEGKGKITSMEISYDDLSKVTDPEIQRLVGALDKIKEGFGYNVDVEWGIDKEGNIYIFQARPIIHRNGEIEVDYKDEYVVAHGKPISQGFSIGKISPITSPKKGTFLYQDEQTNMNDINLLLGSKGVVLRNSSKLSHFSNVLRELSKPCLYLEDFKYEEGKVYAINSFNGDVIDFDKLPTSGKIEMLNAYFRYLKSMLEYSFEKYNGLLEINNDDKFEQVVFDIDEEEILALLDEFGFTKEIIDQKIYTYDLADRSFIENSTIFRIQVSNGRTNIQLKTLDSSNELYRAERGTIICFDSLENAQSYMGQYNMVNTGFQERVITKYVKGDICVNIIKWPGCKPYLGIEVKDVKNLERIKHMLRLEGALITNWGGKEIFEKLNLDLKECSFVRRKVK